jgi:methylglutaconyl-CoA hydratase
MPHYTTLHTHTDSGIHTILLNRPEKRNALSHQLMEDLTHALESFAASQTCRVVIITGAGSSFCAGLDIEHLHTMHAAPGQPTPTEDYNRDAQRIATLLTTLYSLPKPTIAAVNGAAISPSPSPKPNSAIRRCASALCPLLSLLSSTGRSERKPAATCC